MKTGAPHYQTSVLLSLQIFMLAMTLKTNSFNKRYILPIFLHFTVIGAIAYWSIGFAFAFGEPGNFFIGHNHFFSENVDANITFVSRLVPRRGLNSFCRRGGQII